MQKQYVVALFNVLTILAIGYVTAPGFRWYPEAFRSLDAFFSAYLYVCISIIAIAMNVWILVTTLITRGQCWNTRTQIQITGLSICWLLLYIASYFAAYVFLVPLCVASLTLVYYLLNKVSKRLARTLTVITLFVCIAAFFANFEEKYCWDQGVRADPTNLVMVPATKEDVQSLSSFNIVEGGMVSVSFKEHMLCHATFSYTDALKRTFGWHKAL